MSRDFAWNEFVFVLLAMRWTILLSLVAFVAGALGGLGIALLRTARRPLWRAVAIGYIQFFQGTPVLMQLFFFYYGLAVLFAIRLDPWPAVTLAFTCYAAAFLGEIWRGAIQAVGAGQWDAARSLALGRWTTLRKVVLPQALRIAIPATVGFLVQLVKSTSVAALIGFIEVTRAGQLMVNVTFQPLRVFPVVALLYFALCWPLSRLSRRLERRLDSRLGGGVTAGWAA
ncbi:MAG: amino acid ABC transporter permease [Alphaproteobacteria bacterium]|nr:amino acid ABC transporter permease [Alphaproteobacteria bacterium]